MRIFFVVLLSTYVSRESVYSGYEMLIDMHAVYKAFSKSRKSLKSLIENWDLGTGTLKTGILKTKVVMANDMVKTNEKAELI